MRHITVSLYMHNIIVPTRQRVCDSLGRRITSYRHVPKTYVIMYIGTMRTRVNTDDVLCMYMYTL